MRLHLVRPTLMMEEAAIAFRNEFFEAGEKVINGSEMLDHTENYGDWIRAVEKNADPATVNPGWVLTDTFFAMDEAERIVGIIDFRHALKGFLVDFGHVGYSVRPSERRKGYATEMLRQMKEIARGEGLLDLQLSVERSNEPSVRTITRNGGEYLRSFCFEGEAADIYEIHLACEVK